MMGIAPVTVNGTLCAVAPAVTDTTSKLTGVVTTGSTAAVDTRSVVKVNGGADVPVMPATTDPVQMAVITDGFDTVMDAVEMTTGALTTVCSCGSWDTH